MQIKYTDRIILDEEKDNCVSVDEFKAHALIVHDMYDAQVQYIIRAAIKSIETDINVRLRRITVQEHYFPQNGDYAYLRDGNVKVDYVVQVGQQEQLVRNVHFTVHKNKITFIDVPASAEIIVRYLAGYEYAKVPDDIRYAVFMRGTSLFQTRSDLTSENLKLAARCSDNLIAKYKHNRG